MEEIQKTHNQIELVIDSSIITTDTQTATPCQQELSFINKKHYSSSSSILTTIHAGYFRISLSLCTQALLWKTFGDQPNDQYPQSLALSTLLSLSFLYIFKCFYHFKMVKSEFCHHVGVNYLFAPWTSWLLLLQSSPFLAPKTIYYIALWWIFILPVVDLDVKINGQWFTKGKRFLSAVANPTIAAEMGWKKSAICMISLGMGHYLVLFVTLYPLQEKRDRLPVMLNPDYFLFFATPSMASLAWYSISGKFDTMSKMLFFLSLFLFASLITDHLFNLILQVSRPNLFKKSMKRFNIVWWAYSFPLTMLALASAKYAREMKNSVSHGLMLVLSATSFAVFLGLFVYSALNIHRVILNFLPNSHHDEQTVSHINMNPITDSTKV
ncbi:hypothetical protein MKX01_006383 [Papaver californicum]|nr:hypothetical protein MKX01_006383 [Papaver californicum]